MAKVRSASAKGARRGVEVSAVVWIDLLGFGGMLKSADWDPTSESAGAAVARLENFHDLFAKHSTRFFPTSALNDGAAAFRDLSPRTSSVTTEFIERALLFHNELNATEFEHGWPGARAVLAAGFRIRTKGTAQEGLRTGIGAALVRRVASGLIPIKEAILTALAIRPYYGATPELQANFAFSKAYLAESSGSAGGLPGPNFYLDASLLRPTAVLLNSQNWPKIVWSSHGLSSTFVSLGSSHTSSLITNDDTHSAFEVAEALSGSGEIVTRMKSIKLPPR